MFWEGLIMSSPCCSSIYMIRLPCTWLQLELVARQSRECVQLACEADRSSESWCKDSLLVDEGGWKRWKLDSRLGLLMVVSSGVMEGWVFSIGFLNHSRITSIRVGDSRANGLGICCVDFSTLQPLWGGTTAQISWIYGYCVGEPSLRCELSHGVKESRKKENQEVHPFRRHQPSVSSLGSWIQGVRELYITEQWNT